MKEVKPSERVDQRAGRAAPSARTRRLAPPLSTAASSSARCACGGGCPRCSRRAVRVGAPGDALEQEADRIGALLLDDARPALDASEPVDRSRVPAALERAAAARLGKGMEQARIHTGPAAHDLAASLGARAFTFGSDIAFREGEYEPGTERGRRLIAHEMVHVAQQWQATAPTVQRQADVVEMEPLTIRSTLAPVDRAVGDLDRLTGEGVDAADMSVARDDATIARNAPPHAQRLPFTTGAWDAQAILRALGQYDTMPGTDSDAIRCVQAVAMASRIVDGPGGVVGFLRAMILEGMLSRSPAPRQQTALEVLEHVIGRIEMERATFGDLLWAQEALHDLFYNDVSGTPEPEILDRMAPPLELFGRGLQRMDVWCNTPQDVLAAAGQLQPGEQLIVNTWQIVFNTAFDDLEEQGISVPVGDARVVEVNGRRRRLRHIDSSARPAHTAIDTFRDLKTGHQLLIWKDGATGQLRLYEPEITDSGEHLEDLAADGSNFTRYFRDLPDVGIYNYIQILGKLTPSSLSSLSMPPPSVTP